MHQYHKKTLCFKKKFCNYFIAIIIFWSLLSCSSILHNTKHWVGFCELKGHISYMSSDKIEDILILLTHYSKGSFDIIKIVKPDKDGNFSIKSLADFDIRNDKLIYNSNHLYYLLILDKDGHSKVIKIDLQKLHRDGSLFYEISRMDDKMMEQCIFMYY